MCTCFVFVEKTRQTLSDPHEIKLPMAEHQAARGVLIADSPDPIPTQRLDLLKPGRAKARIGHNKKRVKKSCGGFGMG